MTIPVRYGGVTVVICVLGSPQPDDLPPDQAEGCPKSKVDERNEKANSPPGPVRNISSRKQDWSGSCAVVSQRSRKIRAKSQAECHQMSGCAGREENGQKWRVHRDNVRGDAGEQIMC